MKGKINFKTVIILVILVLVGVLGVLGVNTVKTYMSGAAGGSEPKSVLATPGDDGKSGVVTWTTEKATQGIVEYGTTPASLLLRGLETDEATSHRISLSPLKPNTSYYFRIRVGDDVYDNSGIPFSFKTKAGTAAEDIKKAVPTVAAVPTMAAAVAGECNRTTDYNKDGTVNSVDFISCVRNGGKPGQATASGTTECKHENDYDGNGIVNSLDWIKCLQTKK